MMISGLSSFFMMSNESLAAEELDWLSYLMMFLGMPIGLLFVIGIQAGNPFSATIIRGTHTQFAN